MQNFPKRKINTRNTHTAHRDGIPQWPQSIAFQAHLASFPLSPSPLLLRTRAILSTRQDRRPQRERKKGNSKQASPTFMGVPPEGNRYLAFPDTRAGRSPEGAPRARSPFRGACDGACVSIYVYIVSMSRRKKKFFFFF